jgi:two-component system sensor histidine kinase KdpD
VVQGNVNTSPLVAFAVPVRDDAGRVTGLIGGGIRLDATSIGSDSLRFAGGSAVAIIDGNGQMIAGPQPVTRLRGADPAFPFDAMKSAGQGAAGSAIGPEGEADRLIGFATAPTAGWLVLVERSAEEAFGPARVALAAQVLALALGAAIAVVLLLWAGRRLDDAAEAERRNLAALQDAVGQLEHRQALRDAFVGVMSHELRTPVTTIYGAVKLLVKWPRRPDLESLLSDIEEEADRLQRITEDLLVLSRAEHGLVEVRPEPVLLQRLVAGIVADVVRRFPAADVTHDIPADLPPLAADPGAMRQVLDNLLANAAKYGGGTPIEVTARLAGGAARIEVADAGPGLPPGEHDRIFELFYRSPSNERRASGTGIGLFVVRQLVEAMGGTVFADPVKPRGLRFVMLLPLDPAHTADAAAPAPDRHATLEAAAAGG